jgi:hypothetical protein
VDAGVRGGDGDLVRGQEKRVEFGEIMLEFKPILLTTISIFHLMKSTETIVENLTLQGRE